MSVRAVTRTKVTCRASALSRELITNNIKECSHVCFNCRSNVSIPLDIQTEMDCPQCSYPMQSIRHFRCNDCGTAAHTIEEILEKH